MVDVVTFLLFICCCFSVIAIVLAARAKAVAYEVPELPKKLFKELALLDAQLAACSAKLDNHCKRDAGEASVASRKAKAGDNGGATSTPADLQDAILRRDYARLDSYFLNNPEGG